MYFSQGQFSKTETLLIEGNIDPREVMYIFIVLSYYILITGHLLLYFSDYFKI